MDQNGTLSRPIEEAEMLGTEAADAFDAMGAEDEAYEEAWFSFSEAEAEELHRLYPAFDPARVEEDPVLGPYLRGEAMPTMRQLYEAGHMEEIVEHRVREAVTAAVEEAVTTAVAAARESALAEAATEATRQVATAVRESEERLLGHIRARGRRPAEAGVRAAVGIRLHPAVERLTRRDRALLASRAERGETIRL